MFLISIALQANISPASEFYFQQEASTFHGAGEIGECSQISSSSIRTTEMRPLVVKIKKKEEEEEERQYVHKKGILCA